MSSPGLCWMTEGIGVGEVSDSGKFMQKECNLILDRSSARTRTLWVPWILDRSSARTRILWVP